MKINYFILRTCFKNALPIYLEKGILSNMVDQNETRKESSQPQPARCHMKRKSTTGVSYVEPGLRRY